MQECVHDIHRAHPAIALILESHTPETLVRRLIYGQLDLGFIMEPPQLDVLSITEVAELELVMVTTLPDVSIEEAMGRGYVMIDWGLSVALQHRRLYPDAPEPALRMANARVVLPFILEFGGAASWLLAKLLMK